MLERKERKEYKSESKGRERRGRSLVEGEKGRKEESVLESERKKIRGRE